MSSARILFHAFRRPSNGPRGLPIDGVLPNRELAGKEGLGGIQSRAGTERDRDGVEKVHPAANS
jgi:hypothetical protein